MSRPRFVLHDDGTCTIAGVDSGDMASILTAARLYRYEHPVNEDEHGPDCACCLEWERRIVWILEALKEDMDARVRSRYPETVPSLRERLLESDKLRRIVNEAIRERREKEGVS